MRPDPTERKRRNIGLVDHDVLAVLELGPDDPFTLFPDEGAGGEGNCPATRSTSSRTSRAHDPLSS